MLWLLLVSGTALKWAGVAPSSTKIFAAAQIALSSGVVVFGIAAFIVGTAWGSAVCMVRCCDGRGVGSSDLSTAF